MIFLRACVFLVLFYVCMSQEYDFGAEIKRQCLVPDPVGLLDCVENKVTLPYLTSWVDCTNSLGQNVKTSADIINYRCKSVWEGKAVIPEVFYIKDCVIEKTGLPAKNVSAEVLGAYKECENSPKPPVQKASLSFSGVKSTPIQQQQIDVSGHQPTVQQPQPIQQAPLPVVQSLAPASRQPYSQQFFVLYPRAPLPVQQVPIVQQQTPAFAPQQIQQQQLSNIPIFQQQISQQPVAFPVTGQQQIPTYLPQAQISQQPYMPQTHHMYQYPVPFQVQSQAPVSNNPYRYEFQVRHPQQRSSIKV